MLIIDTIEKAQNIILSTHKSSDGDGLGSEIAMYHALKKIGKHVRFAHIDIIPARYNFLLEHVSQNDFLTIPEIQQNNFDLALIFDTHDPKLCNPLFESLIDKKIPIYFIDHHIKIKETLSDQFLVIDEAASCTGEIVFDLINKMKIPLDKKISSSLYASLIFDTQNFKVIRNSVRPFAMASQLLSIGINSQSIQDQLFANWNVEKMSYLAYLIPHVSYFNDNQIAVIRILKKDLENFKVEIEQVSDLIDFFMQIKSLTLAIVIREESPIFCKLSFRSRQTAKALEWAQAFSGGGHSMSAGAWVNKSLIEIETKIKNLIATGNI